MSYVPKGNGVRGVTSLCDDDDINPALRYPQQPVAVQPMPAAVRLPPRVL